MFTSRAEYRLILRQDNADQRLMAKGHKLGLVSSELYNYCMEKYNAVDREIQRLEATTVVPNPKNLTRLSKLGINELRNATTLNVLLRRPEVKHKELLRAFEADEVPQLVGEQVEIQIKYEGFIQRQTQVVANQSKLENQKIPVDFEYEGIPGLSCEVVQKLEKIRPSTLGQASRISGVTAAAVSIIMLMLKRPVKV